MRTFELTHPWLKFQAHLGNFGPNSWIVLGEVAADCEHLARAPLLPEAVMDLRRDAVARAAWAMTALGNNTLSEEQVRRAVAGGFLQVSPSQENSRREVDNMIALLNEICAAGAGPESRPLSVEVVCGYQARIVNGMDLPESVRAGEFRHHSVVVAGAVYRGAPASDCPHLVERLCEWLNGPDFTPEPGRETAFAILRAVTAHAYLSWIQPFGDGNGRTARATEFHLLTAAGIPAAAAHLLSRHYHQTRAEYYFQLDLASRSGGDLLPFFRYALRGMAEGLKAQVAGIEARQWELTWRARVDELFPDQNAAGDLRQRQLALDLHRHSEWINIGAIPDMTPRLAKAYAHKTPKTLQRDLNLLAELGLIDREARRVRARRQLVAR